MEIRKYKKEDYPQIVEILKESDLFDENWDSSENINTMNALIAKKDKQIVGIIYLINFGEKVGWIFRLAVKKDYRNKGLATELINVVEKNSRKMGIKEIGLYVNSDDEELQHFYRKRDFKSSKKPYIYMYKSLED